MQGNVPKTILKKRVEIFTLGAADVQPQPKKLLDRVRDAIRVKHYSYQTEKTYGQWIRRFILFHDKHHPSEMESVQVNTFLVAVHRD